MVQADIQQIIDAAEATRADMDALEADVTAEIKEIRQAAFLAGRPMTPEEVKRSDMLETSLGQMLEAYPQIAFQLMKALDGAISTQQLVESFQGINDRLEDALKRLKAIAKFTETAAAILDALAKIATKVAGLAL